MRYQERIYIQNNNDAVRNKDILSFNMSSDMSIFEGPLFNVSGASKIDCTGITSSYVISTGTTIPLTFVFTANTNSFTANTTSFKYEVYKFDSNLTAFTTIPVYKSNLLEYSGFSGTNSTYQTIPVNQLLLDGEYLIKGYYEYSNTTEYLNKLGIKTDTLLFKNGVEYGIYDKNVDYYFNAIKSASIPLFSNNGSNVPLINSLFQQLIFPETISANTINVTVGYVGAVILTLNGAVLAPTLDYTIDGSVIVLAGDVSPDDLLTLVYTTSNVNNLSSDILYITTPIASGSTDNQGSNTSYYNTTTGKYEIYTDTTPLEGNSILVMLNGVTLANGGDYYQSISNPKRIILEGDLLIEDIITIVYYPTTTVINGLITSNPIVSWRIANSPELVNGNFILEVSDNNMFSSFIYTGVTDYVIGQLEYNDNFIASGSIGSKLYYRVKNVKDYITFCGNIINSTVYSEVIPLTIQTNAINSY